MRKSRTIRFALVLALLAVFCIPSVFTPVANSLAYTANWVSRQVGWDWHSISSSWSPDRNILTTRPSTHWTVWLVLFLVFLDVALLVCAAFVWKKISSRARFFFQLLIEVNIGFVCFVLLALWIRLNVDWGNPP